MMNRKEQIATETLNRYRIIDVSTMDGGLDTERPLLPLKYALSLIGS